MSSISIKKAAFVNFISKYANIFIQILYQSVLARILTPNDFGIVAVIMVFTTFFMVFADMGLGTAVIQNKKLTREDTNNIFSFTVYFGIGLALIFCLFSVPLAYFYNDEAYKSIGCLLSISLFFNTLNMIPNALLLKEKRFIAVGVRLVVVSIISSVFTIILAIGGLKYYSIVFYSIFTAFFTFLWNELSVKARFSFKFKMSSLKKVFNYSAFQFAFNIINYFSRNLDNLLIGKFMGNEALAFYDKGYRLMLYPVQNLTHVITPVLHPILSEHQNDKVYIYKKYLKVIKILSLLGVFISPFCFFASNEIIYIVYGDQWFDSVLSFQWLALSVWPQMIASSTGSIFQSVGNTKLMFKSSLITTAVSVIGIIFGISFGNIQKVSLFVMISQYINFFVVFYFLIKLEFKTKMYGFLKQFIPDCIIFINISIFLYGTNFIKIDNLITLFLLKLTIGCFAYISGLFITKQYKYLLTLKR